MIFVTAGTHEAPFDRLVRAADALAAAFDEDVVLQRGYSRERADRCLVYDLLSPEEMTTWMSRARCVITHGGPATILLALAHDHVPLVVPRRRAFGEHVDDHQVAFVQHLGDRVHAVDDPADLVEAVRGHHAHVASLPPRPSGDQTSEAFARGLQTLVEALIERRRAPGGRLRTLLSAWRG